MEYYHILKKKRCGMVIFLAAACTALCSCKWTREINFDDIKTDPQVQSTNIPSSAPKELITQELIIDKKQEIYTYDDMKKDINTLKQIYPDIITVNELCTTADTRKVYDVVVGDLNSAEHIMIIGSMHAREYITTQLVLTLMTDLLKNYESYTYNGISSEELIENTAIHFIPMSNPDGVTVAQLGSSALRTQKAR